MKKSLGWVIVTALVGWVGVYFVGKMANDRETARMVALAESFAIPQSWALLDERIEREQMICLGSNPCPSMSRRWQTDEQLTADDLHRIAKGTGTTLSVEGDCTRPANRRGNVHICDGSAVSGPFAVTLSVESNAPEGNSILGLDIRPSGG